MATITGPKLQTPTSLTPISDQNGVVSPQWQVYFHGLQQIAFNLSRSGPTSSRPTASLDGRYIGMPFFDTTKGFPVYLKTATPFSSSDVWVRYDGTPA